MSVKKYEADVFYDDGSVCREIVITERDHDRIVAAKDARIKHLEDALGHLDRELNNGQVLEPDGPNHIYVIKQALGGQVADKKEGE